MKIRLFKDKVISGAMLVFSILSVSMVLLIGVGLYWRSLPILQDYSVWELISSNVWRPLKGSFGFYPFIMGTLWVTGMSIAIAIPLCLLTAIYVSEYAPNRFKNFFLPMINMLAGIPPVIYGVWGVLFVVPLVQKYVAPFFVDFSTGFTVLAGGIVLAVMIFPLIVSIIVEVLQTIPKELREASLSLGATKWETIKKVVLRKAMPGIIAAIVLAVSRAFGETIAVLMVCGNVPIAPQSIFDPAYPLPALLANNFGEMMSVPLYDAALMFSALALFVIILIFNIISRLILQKISVRNA
ncbi:MULTISPECIES: phosphate ABC transporter permease subunit PstC [Olivibacter]|jgi:phosphate transport system permease protein|uniref:Phosphate transport system permease protein n=1 Tax=Olivibacter oleidegradans TaxID=760123 RepID=A0ABV6HNE6_9SPHI|nr:MULTISPECIES: phosphate ABC transporter permease subunit PstC [Olivibacter]MDX3915222.1 phosphate ABC transporter permease subunit PstC [Pseudosphingobacterium sp.]QEL03116.1 phosphate ABC transporter permease subunit PstC [Olivibacter sp. LS-1]